MIQVIRRHRETGELVLVVLEGGQPIGATPILIGLPADLFEIDFEDLAFAREALGPAYEDADPAVCDHTPPG